MFKVTSSNLTQHFGENSEKAMRNPIAIMKHKREALVLQSFHRYQQTEDIIGDLFKIKNVKAEEISDDLMAEIMAAEYGE